MKKIAIFVEGKTERLFVEKLLKEMVTEKRLSITVLEYSGGGSAGVRTVTLRYQTTNDPAQEFFVQIVQCGNDERVATDIADSYTGLMREGFTTIIGMRDVYPEAMYAQVPLLRQGLGYRFARFAVKPVFVLGVMEIEAWFLREHSHFGRIHSNLTCARVLAELGFDPNAEDMQARPCPSDDLHRIYQLEGRAYIKHGHRSQIQRTMDALDYDQIYFHMINDFPDLKNLIDTLNSFFLSQ